MDLQREGYGLLDSGIESVITLTGLSVHTMHKLEDCTSVIFASAHISFRGANPSYSSTFQFIISAPYAYHH